MQILKCSSEKGSFNNYNDHRSEYYDQINEYLIIAQQPYLRNNYYVNIKIKIQQH